MKTMELNVCVCVAFSTSRWNTRIIISMRTCGERQYRPSSFANEWTVATDWEVGVKQNINLIIWWLQWVTQLAYRGQLWWFSSKCKTITLGDKISVWLIIHNMLWVTHLVQSIPMKICKLSGVNFSFPSKVQYVGRQHGFLFHQIFWA
jgi:hypothetical protein